MEDPGLSDSIRQLYLAVSSTRSPPMLALQMLTYSFTKQLFCLLSVPGTGWLLSGRRMNETRCFHQGHYCKHVSSPADSRSR